MPPGSAVGTSGDHEPHQHDELDQQGDAHDDDDPSFDASWERRRPRVTARALDGAILKPR
ncbi:hypothetical protein GCM10027200_16080 [Lentzea nigeriaca]